MTQSMQLTEFYQAYLAWLDAGAPADKPFSRSYGLCDNLTMYCEENRIKEDIVHELTKQFAAQKLSTVYPFDRENSYCNECDNNIAHLNLARISWVKDHANV